MKLRWPRLDVTLVRIRKVFALLANPVFLRAYLRHRVAPAIEHADILRALPFDFVVDAGANRGQFSLICRRLRPRARIMAFEPLGDVAATYAALFRDDDKVAIHVSALGPQSGELPMNIAGRDDSSSLLPISDMQTTHYPGTEAVGTRMVRIAPLSSFLEPADLAGRNLFKIDVQGFELEVLKSAQGLLDRFDWIYVECSFVPLYEGQALADEVVAYLAAHGFHLAGQHNPSRAGIGNDTLLQADLLFVNGARAY